MENVTQEVQMKKVWKNAIFTTLKILLAAVVFFYFTLMSIFFISPLTSAKIFKFMNLVSAEETCYEYAYDRDKNIHNLYNLVMFKMEHDKNMEELYYLNLLLADNGYREFCNKLDKSSLSTVSDKSLIAYSCNSNSFLLNQKIKCMYNLNISSDTIQKFIEDKIKYDDVPEYTLSTYVDLVLANNNLSTEQKQNLFNDLKNKFSDPLNTRVTTLVEKAGGETNQSNKIILQYALTKNLEVRLVIAKQTGSDIDTLTNYKSEYETARNAYYNLIKN